MLSLLGVIQGLLWLLHLLRLLGGRHDPHRRWGYLHLRSCSLLCLLRRRALLGSAPLPLLSLLGLPGSRASLGVAEHLLPDQFQLILQLLVLLLCLLRHLLPFLLCLLSLLPSGHGVCASPEPSRGLRG